MTARELARKVLARVEEGAYASLALSGELAKARGMSGADRGLATEIVYGVLRQRRRLDHALAAHAPRGIGGLDARVMDALRVGAYQILLLRVPAHAAVDDAVEAVKHARGVKMGGFANALLRKLAAGEPAPPPENRVVERLGVMESAPDWLVEDALARFGAEEAREFLASLNQPAPQWLRTNTLRITRQALRERLLGERPGAQLSDGEVPEALCAQDFGDVTASAAFGEGLYTVQDVAAQRIAHLVAPEAGETILDACAGVGGKSSHLAALAGDRATVDAADLSERKLELCADAARRMGVTSVRPVVCDLTDPRAPLQPSYHRILLDAPCSGLGVLRRHPEAKWRRESMDVAALAQVQAAMLDALAGRLRPGGTLVYSVCTFTDAEGPSQIARLLAAHPELAADGEPLRTWPHRDASDAFYAVRLRRIG